MTAVSFIKTAERKYTEQRVVEGEMAKKRNDEEQNWIEKMYKVCVAKKLTKVWKCQTKLILIFAVSAMQIACGLWL